VSSARSISDQVMRNCNNPMWIIQRPGVSKLTAVPTAIRHTSVSNVHRSIPSTPLKENHEHRRYEPARRDRGPRTRPDHERRRQGRDHRQGIARRVCPGSSAPVPDGSSAGPDGSATAPDGCSAAAAEDSVSAPIGYSSLSRSNEGSLTLTAGRRVCVARPFRVRARTVPGGSDGALVVQASACCP
jgi:hypothetical protein